MSSSTSEAAAKAVSLDTFSKFINLYNHAKSLIGLHGKYTTSSDPIVFTRAPRAPSSNETPSEEEIAHSFSAAQDSIHTVQPPGPANDDLQLFKLLWDAATDALEKALEDGHLDLEVRAWGIIGLAAGYMNPQTTPAADKYDFATYRNRLHAALESLPSLTTPHNNRASGVSPEQRAHLLIKARREVHICSNLLLEQFRKEGWASVKWYCGLAVAERWVGNLTYAKAVTVNKETQEALDACS